MRGVRDTIPQLSVFPLRGGSCGAEALVTDRHGPPRRELLRRVRARKKRVPSLALSEMQDGAADGGLTPMNSLITRVRIIAPPDRAREDVAPEELQSGDTFEIIDRPVYEIHPHTWKATATLQQFVMSDDNSLKLKRATSPALDMAAIIRAVGRTLNERR